MRLLDIIAEAAVPFSKVSEVAQYINLRKKLQQTYPEGWCFTRRLELEHWRHFRGISYTLHVLRQNASNNLEIPQHMLRSTQSLVDDKLTKDLEAMTLEIATFVDNLSSYFLRPDAKLATGNLKLPSALRRLFLDAKGCLQSNGEFRKMRQVIAKSALNTRKKAELYEQEMSKRNIVLPILQDSYALALEIAGDDTQTRKFLIATKQLLDTVKIIQQLLFNLTVFNKECSFQVDEGAINFQYEEKPFGRIVKCHAIDVPPLMIPGHILRLIEPSTELPIYVGVLSVEWKYDGKTKETIIDLSGIDLEDTGPKLLSRFAE